MKRVSRVLEQICYLAWVLHALMFDHGIFVHAGVLLQRQSNVGNAIKRIIHRFQCPNVSRPKLVRSRGGKASVIKHLILGVVMIMKRFLFFFPSLFHMR